VHQLILADPILIDINTPARMCCTPCAIKAGGRLRLLYISLTNHTAASLFVTHERLLGRARAHRIIEFMSLLYN